MLLAFSLIGLAYFRGAGGAFAPPPQLMSWSYYNVVSVCAHASEVSNFLCHVLEHSSGLKQREREKVSAHVAFIHKFAAHGTSHTHIQEIIS